MNSKSPTLGAIEVLQSGELVREDFFLGLLQGREEVCIRVPLPSHGRSNSYLDICDDLLDASYFCETLSAEFRCGKLQRESHENEDCFLLPIKYKNAHKLAAALHRLQWVFSSSEDQSSRNLLETTRDAVADHEEKMSEGCLRYPEIADGYLTNRIGGAYFEFTEDLLNEEFSRYPERRFGFFRSPYFDKSASSVFISHDTWLIPTGIERELAFKTHGYPAHGISLLNADLLTMNGTAFFLSESMVITLPFAKLANGMACLKFTEEDAVDGLWPGVPKAYVSEFKDFVLVEFARATVVLFDVAEARIDLVDRTHIALLEKYRSSTYTDFTVRIEWSLFNDEKFEELCYDLVYHDPRFDKSSIRKMGKSRSRDGGRDIIANTHRTAGKEPKKFIFQCKAIAPDKSVTTSNLGSISDVIDQYGAEGYVVMTSGFIDATVFDRLDGIKATRRTLEVITWSRFEIERFLARRPSLLARYNSYTAVERVDSGPPTFS